MNPTTSPPPPPFFRLPSFEVVRLPSPPSSAEDSVVLHRKRHVLPSKLKRRAICSERQTSKKAENTYLLIKKTFSAYCNF